VLDDAELVAFPASRDLEASARFHAGVLGLKPLESSPFACAFDANGTILRVTLVEQLPGVRYTVLGWKVSDIAASIGALTAKGVRFTRFSGPEQDENGAWVAPGGSRIAWFADPDGTTLSLRQAPPG
jgi:catechol 2,3-dioxygenase-like lactoylglutathione lyase family enzyme